MIRFFVLIGLVGGALVAWLTTAGVGPISQLPPPESLLTRFREAGYVPASPNLEEDETAEEMGVFEVPEADEAYLEEAKEAFDNMMGGMDMSSSDGGNMDMGNMDMSSSDGGSMDMSNMDMSSSDGGDMDMSNMDMSSSDGGDMDMGNMDMSSSDGGDMDMSNMDMSSSDGGDMDMSNMDMSSSDGGNMDMSNMDMSSSDGGDMDMGEGGLLVTEDGEYDREIVLTMSEWKFSAMNIDVKAGERIKFTVKNGGQIPHEFMFMSPPLMQAVTYRATRADWSLFEHEALYEKALVLPSGEFSFVLKVTEPGSWMFMCMLPYHMQMGMMGQMATEGMAMDMDM